MRMIASDAQEAIEYAYGKKHINRRIDRALRQDTFVENKVTQGIELLEEWLNQTYYASKQVRLDSLRNSNLELIVRTTFNVVAVCQAEELFTSVAGMLATTFNMDETVNNIKTAAEILAVLCNTDVYDILRNQSNSIVIKSNFKLPQDLIESIDRSMYLPPMLIPPKRYTSNNSSPYLTLDKDCLILGKKNSHTGDLCLDVLNTQNQIELKLATDFMDEYPEEPPSKPQAYNIDDWKRFLTQSKEVYQLLRFHGNRFFIPTKIDKRGRIYSLGYHVNYQSYKWKKAVVELATEETIDVPAEYQITRTE